MPMWKSINYFPSLLDTKEDNFGFSDLLPFSCTHGKGLSVSEDATSVWIEASVPGLKQEDVDLSISESKLWIRGERSEQKEDKKRKYYRKASYSYSYCVNLPETVDQQSEPKATYENGIVQIVFPKKQGAEPKKIALKQS
ncbi:MAG TPA: Hsp20/alpha crystallin family protein [Amoebophilaceae bacterium]|nr:Hsp20/alpha crystallin family protein [Amoebophilaceae bacterium]